MPKAWSAIKQRGFSAVEVLLAATIFGMLLTGLIGAFVYGRSSTVIAGDRVRATQLSEEGIEATRNIRDANFSNLTDGTFGIVQSGNTWTLSGSSDSNGIYTRQVTIASGATNRKTVTSTVSWTTAGQTRQVVTTAQLTNWKAAILTSWANATFTDSYDAASTQNAVRVATAGNYAYVVRSDGTPDFLILDISGSGDPTLVGSLSLAGVPTDITVNGNYAYVANSGNSTELQIINITNPAAPILTGTYDAPGSADGFSVQYSNGYAWLSRAANFGVAELAVVNVATPNSPSLAGSYGNNSNMRALAVANNYAFIGTDNDSQEIMIINFTNTLTFPPTAATINLTGTNNVTAVHFLGNKLFIGQRDTLYVYNVATPSAPALLGSLTLGDAATINDIDFDSTGNYAFLATTNTANEFRVINIANPAAMSIAKSINVTGTTSTLGGVAYNTPYNIVIGASASDTEEVMIFRPN